MRIPEGILEEIFESIKGENNLHDVRKISNYLKNLKSNLKVLRSAYRRKGRVIIDYKDKKRIVPNLKGKTLNEAFYNKH